MGKGEIKSSVELAMERLAEMPRLSPEEAAELQRKELVPVGQGLAAKYLDGRLRDDELTRELKKYADPKAEIVTEALISALLQTIDLDNSQRTGRVFAALKTIGRYTHLADIEQRVEKVIQEYQRQKALSQEQYEREYRASLRKRGISGSALRPNLKDSKRLRASLDELTQAHKKKLTDALRALDALKL
jgi:hypothetical protein